MHVEGGCVWQKGGVHGEGGACVAGVCTAGVCMAGVCAWQGVCMAGGGACVAGRMCGGGHAWQERWPLQRKYASYWNAFLLSINYFHMYLNVYNITLK